MNHPSGCINEIINAYSIPYFAYVTWAIPLLWLSMMKMRFYRHNISSILALVPVFMAVRS